MFSLKNWRQIKRTKQVVHVLTKFGLDYLIGRSKTNFWLKIRKKPIDYPKITISAERLRLALEELGPTFIKFGQILSTRPDFLPPAFIKELEKLQDKAPPFSSFQAQEIVEKELKKPLGKLFKKFETKPVAAASLSQVHRAILPNNEVVAVKIQRPNIKEIIELDLEILENLAGFLETCLYNNWVYRPKLIVTELKKAIKREIDFTNEAYNYERFRINFKGVRYIKVPKIYWEMSTPKVLTMEFMKGVKINEITRDKYKNIFNTKKVAERGAHAILKQILEDGFFHADPHPANLLVQEPATIVMLDLGMVGYLDRETRINGARFLQAIVNQDSEQVINCLESLGIIIREIDKNLLQQDLKELLDRYWGMPLKYLEIRKITQDILKIMIQYHLVLPSNLVLMIKTLSMAETIGKQLDPDFDMISAVKPFTKNLLWKEFTPRELLKKSSVMFRESVELVERLPADLIDILQKLKGGRLKFNFEYYGLEKLAREINRSSNRLSLSFVIAGLIIGSSLVLQQQVGPFIFGYPVLGIIGYLLAVFLVVGLIISILRSGRNNL